MTPDITVVISTIPERADLLARAVRSVAVQTLKPSKIFIALDNEFLGAAYTRNKAIKDVSTEWIAFLDDDDEFMPEHLEKLYGHAMNTNADFVHSWFEVVGGIDPFPYQFGMKFEKQSQTTITVLVKTEVAKAVYGFARSDSLIPEDLKEINGNLAGEDFHFASKIYDAGYKMEVLQEKTWLWHHDSRNTSGMVSRRH